MTDGVARVGYARVRRLAAGLLTGQTEAPVDLNAIADQLAAEIRIMPLSADISGILYRQDDRRVIVVNEAHNAARRRFTIAHELGHLVLHRGTAVHVDDSFRFNLRSPRSSTADDVEEIEANAFAANLLMPAVWLRNDLKDDTIDLNAEDEVRLLADRYQVSVQAMMLRLTSLYGDN